MGCCRMCRGWRPCSAIVGSEVSKGPLLRNHGVTVEFKYRDRLKGEFRPIRLLWRVEDAFAELGRWRRLVRSFEGTPTSATVWM
jgi:hypothetical protein